MTEPTGWLDESTCPVCGDSVYGHPRCLCNGSDLRSKVESLTAERDEARAAVTLMGAERTELIEWICAVLGYPYDFTTDPPIPPSFRAEVEQFWFEDDGDERYEQAIKQTVAEEGGWLTEGNDRD